MKGDGGACRNLAQAPATAGPCAPCGASRCVCSSKAKRLAARLSVRSGRTDAGSIRPRSSGISADRPDRPRRGGGAENKSGAVRVPLAVVSLLCDPHLGGGHSPLWANAEGGKERVKREKTGRGTGSEGRRRRESRMPHSATAGSRGAVRGGQPRPGATGSGALRWPGGGEPPGLRPEAGSRLSGLGGRVRGSPPAPSSAPSAHKGGRSPPTAGGVGRRSVEK